MLQFNLRAVRALCAMLLAVCALPAHAALDNFYSATGKLGLSVDGCGTAVTTTCTVNVDKPSAGATVRAAFLMSISDGGSNYQIPDGQVKLNSQPVSWDASAHIVGVGLYEWNYRADVTALVKPALDAAPAGLMPFTIDEGPQVEGHALVVVFNDPAQTSDSSVLLNFGAQDTTGDTFNITLASPVDPAAPGARLDMGLGIAFGYQESGADQNSIVTVNGQLLTSSAGGSDDCRDPVPHNGCLITVGGLGDSNDNPADPTAPATNARSDDELYSLLPFVDASTTAIAVHTVNPSNDDNIFFAYFHTSAPAIVGAGILLSQTVNTHPVGSSHTVRALVTDTSGTPQANVTVTFTVTNGPNLGETGTAVTNASGFADYTYTDSGGEGNDTIEASTMSAGVRMASNALNVSWIKSGGGGAAPAVPTLSEAGTMLAVLLLAGVGAARLRRRQR